MLISYPSQEARPTTMLTIACADRFNEVTLTYSTFKISVYDVDGVIVNSLPGPEARNGVLLGSMQRSSCHDLPSLQTGGPMCRPRYVCLRQIIL